MTNEGRVIISLGLREREFLYRTSHDVYKAIDPLKSAGGGL